MHEPNIWELVYNNQSVVTEQMCEIFEIEFDKDIEVGETQRYNFAIYSSAKILIWTSPITCKTLSPIPIAKVAVFLQVILVFQFKRKIQSGKKGCH